MPLQQIATELNALDGAISERGHARRALVLAQRHHAEERADEARAAIERAEAVLRQALRAR